MANHQSAKKRNRQGEARKIHNRYYARTARMAIRKLRSASSKEEAEKLYPQVVSMLDRLAKKNIIHPNKAANLKSSLSKYVAELS